MKNLKSTGHNLSLSLGIFLIFMTLSISGCNKAYLPWVQSSNWDCQVPQQSDEIAVRALLETQSIDGLENFCNDLEADVGRWEAMLLHVDDWNLSPPDADRRARYLRTFLVQFERMCSN